MPISVHCMSSAGSARDRVRIATRAVSYLKWRSEIEACNPRTRLPRRRLKLRSHRIRALAPIIVTAPTKAVDRRRAYGLRGACSLLFSLCCNHRGYKRRQRNHRHRKWAHCCLPVGFVIASHCSIEAPSVGVQKIKFAVNVGGTGAARLGSAWLGWVRQGATRRRKARHAFEALNRVRTSGQDARMLCGVLPAHTACFLVAHLDPQGISRLPFYPLTILHVEWLLFPRRHHCT